MEVSRDMLGYALEGPLIFLGSSQFVSNIRSALPRRSPEPLGIPKGSVKSFKMSPAIFNHNSQTVSAYICYSMNISLEEADVCSLKFNSQ
jgi:hypothetical protein